MIFLKFAISMIPSSPPVFTATGVDDVVAPATFFHAGYPAANTITSL